MRTLGAALLLVLASSASNAQQLTRTCFFLAGPSEGTTRHFAGYPPIRVGSQCNDGAGGVGVAVPDGVRPQGQFRLHGDQPTCNDLLGTAVPYRFNSNIPKSGLATVVNNEPVIFLRAQDMASFSPPVRRFLLAHECGHHALGQVIAALYYRVNIDPRGELAADCFAANQLKRLGRLPANEWEEILAFISGVPGDPTTLPGPQRVSQLRRCAD